MTLIIVIAVIALLVMWVISVQNKLVKSDEICNNALKQINVQQISRYDALQALIKLTREYAGYEADTLQKIVDAEINNPENYSATKYSLEYRLSVQDSTGATTNYGEHNISRWHKNELRDGFDGLYLSEDAAKADAERFKATVLKEISAKLIAVAEAYPDLKANQNYQQTMASIEKYEENVRLSRMTFNDTVTRFNQQVRVFPTSLIAGMLGFAKRDYLADDVTKKDYPAI